MRYGTRHGVSDVSEGRRLKGDLSRSPFVVILSFLSSSPIKKGNQGRDDQMVLNHRREINSVVKGILM